MKDQDKSHEDKFSSVGPNLSRRIEKASEELTDSLVSDKEGYITLTNPLSSNKGGESYKEEDSTDKPGDEELGAASYNSSATEVDSGVYQAIHKQKYVTPKNFCQQLWNDGGPSVKLMKILLEMIKMELKGKAAGLEADMSHFFTALIDFMIKEAGEDSNDALAFLEHIAIEIKQWEEEYSEDDDHATPIAKPQDSLPPDKEAEQFEASKT